jgi:hypothetical protein
MTYSTTTADAGGYDLALPQGTYSVTFSGSGIAEDTHQITIEDANVKLDLADPATGEAQPQTAAESGPSAVITATSVPAPVPPQETVTAEPDVTLPVTAEVVATPETVTPQPVDDPVPATNTSETGIESDATDPTATADQELTDQVASGDDAGEQGHHVGRWWAALDAFDVQPGSSGSNTQSSGNASLHWDAQGLTDFLSELRACIMAPTGDSDPFAGEAASHFPADIHAKHVSAHDLFI